MTHLAALLSPCRTALAILLALTTSLTTFAQTIAMNPTDGPYGGTVVDVLLDRDGSLFAATAVGLFRSTDDGESWEMNAFDGINVRYLRRDSAEFIYAGTDSGLYRSGDGGARWSRYLGEYSRIQDIAFHANGSVFLSTTGYLHRSTDNGSSWDSLSVISGFGGPRGGMITTAEASLVYLNTSFELLKSTDNGDTWCTVVSAIIISGLPQAAIPWGSSWFVDALIPIGGGDTVLTAIGDSIQRHWLCDEDDLFGEEPEYFHFLSGLDGAILAATRSRGILRTTDLGESWVPFASSPSSIIDMTYDAEGDLIAGAPHGVLQVDAGAGSASLSSTGMTALDITALAVDSTNGVLAATDVGIFRTRDGETWEPIGLLGRDITSIKVAPNGTIYAGTASPGTVALSTDGGATWRTRLSPPQTRYYSVTILEASDTRVLFTTSGATLTTPLRDEPLPPQLLTVENGSVDPIYKKDSLIGISAVRGADGRLYASARTTTTEKRAGLYISNDDGTTFTLSAALPADHTYRLIASNDGTLYAHSDNSTLFRSDDDGDTWTPLTSSLPGILTLPSSNARNELYLLQNRTLYRSIDKGSFWEELDTDLPPALAITVVDRDGYLYAGGDGLRVYRSSMTTVGVDDEDGALEPMAMTVAPNPSEGEAELRFHLEERGEVQIRVVDMKGKVHLEKRMMAEKGELLERLDLSSLPSGTYTVVVEQREKRFEKKIVVVR